LIGNEVGAIDAAPVNFDQITIFSRRVFLLARTLGPYLSTEVARTLGPYLSTEVARTLGPYLSTEVARTLGPYLNRSLGWCVGGVLLEKQDARANECPS
jgi:hypothetical protein